MFSQKSLPHGPPKLDNFGFGRWKEPQFNGVQHRDPAMSQGQWHFVLFFAALFHVSVSLFHYKNCVFFSSAKNQLKDWPGVCCCWGTTRIWPRPPWRIWGGRESWCPCEVNLLLLPARWHGSKNVLVSESEMGLDRPHLTKPHKFVHSGSWLI